MTAEGKKCALGVPKTALKLILGIALLVVGVRLVWLWRWDVYTVIRGFLGIIVAFAGVIFLAIAKE